MLKNLTNKSGLFSPKLYAGLLMVGGILQLAGYYFGGELPLMDFADQIFPQIEGLLLLLAGGALAMADRKNSVGQCREEMPSG